MKTTVEISNYPLNAEYEPIILDFIERCQATGITVKVNATSTHLQGDYDVVMNIVQKEIKASFEKFGKMIFVVKVLLGELDLDFSM
ncbi:thiamine-binding protein [Crocinitomicaceae bacterium]|nr:thiamine-binding protein [Crocinitomicaceae bacterium]MDB3906684.1 thiamine-binding protein [Crocinitomicaceae bacterium]MDC0257635.1 thiamine-binding protein [Crocinitomicaceae bacterium]